MGKSVLNSELLSPQTNRLLRCWLFLFLFGSALARVFGSEENPDATAKFLAGLPVRGTSLENRSLGRAWPTYAAELDRAWNRLEQEQLSRIRTWDSQFLGDVYTDTEPVFYMFSGPDFIYPNVFFPNAQTYILCGREPVGSVPDIDSISQRTLLSALSNLRRSLDSVLSWSFFITKQMKANFSRTPLKGTLPVLYVFLAREGATIESVSLVSLDNDGNIVDAGKTHGAKIVFVNASGAEQTLYYFSTDLSDAAIKTAPGFMKFCEKEAPGLTLLKASSYLMFRNHFTRVRDFLLTCSKVIVQDDSGIPVKFFDHSKWNVRYCGRYMEPIRMFKQFKQPDLAKSFMTTTPNPLGFGFGYEWRPNRSSLIIATPK
jgi:hypothetical protein